MQETSFNKKPPRMLQASFISVDLWLADQSFFAKMKLLKKIRYYQKAWVQQHQCSVVNLNQLVNAILENLFHRISNKILENLSLESAVCHVIVSIKMVAVERWVLNELELEENLEKDQEELNLEDENQELNQKIEHVTVPKIGMTHTYDTFFDFRNFWPTRLI